MKNLENYIRSIIRDELDDDGILAEIEEIVKDEIDCRVIAEFLLKEFDVEDMIREEAVDLFG